MDRHPVHSLSVQHKCMQHSIPIVSWHTCTKDEVRSAFLPPAPLKAKHQQCTLSPLDTFADTTTYQVMSMNSGPRFRIRSIRSYRFCRPYTLA